MSDEPAPESGIDEKPDADRARAGLFRNFTSLIGASIAVASVVGILFLFLAESQAASDNPYVGIFTYIIFPAFMIGGLGLMAAGALIERRRRHRFAPSTYHAHPIIDLNNPVQRRRLVAFMGLTFSFLFVSAFGSYRAYEYTDSVAFCGQLCHEPMRPEFIAYEDSPHARVRCVDCHVGPGATWYVRSKLSGAYQVYAVLSNNFPRPIPTPVHSLRPAQETCEQCHWPEKFFGAQLKIFNRYGYDEKNTLYQTRMLIKTGGGSPSRGLVAGIHWHMNIANEITYAWSDEQRQVIPWVRLKDPSGNIEEYVLSDAQLTGEQIEALPKRVMDCVDCHNRPVHIFHSPDTSVDRSFTAGRLDPTLPYLKRQAVDVLSKPFSSTDEAVRTIKASIDEYYRANHRDIYDNKGASINAAAAEIERIYRGNFFPEMKVDWQTHPDNIGHYYFQGCFRCHDGKHVSKTGKVIRNECNICHDTLDQTEGGVTVTVKGDQFQHPGFFGNITRYKCSDCHTGRGMVAKFQHPVTVDIANRDCADCHLSRR